MFARNAENTIFTRQNKTMQLKNSSEPVFSFVNGAKSKRYYTFSEYLYSKFGKKVYKITLDAGFSCPNRDGTISTGGCIFCDESGSFSMAHSSRLSVKEQVQTAINNFPKRFKAELFLAYFQAFSNTYAPVDVLKNVYDDAFSDPRVIGISIGTRPDCVDKEKLTLISTYPNAWLELGLQSAHDKTLQAINRGHDFNCFKKAFELAKALGIKVCVHIILGLPGETPRDMLETARILASLGVDGIKIHALTVLQNTPLAKIHALTPIPLLSEDEYCNLVADIIEILPKTASVHRVGGSGLSNTLIAPLWARNKFETMNKIDRILWERDAYQGDKFRP